MRVRIAPQPLCSGCPQDHLYCAQYLTALSLSPHPTLRSLRGGECLTHPCTPRPSTAPATHAQKCLLSRTKQLGPFQH